MTTVAQRSIQESQLYKQYCQARLALERITHCPDTPWIIDDYIDSTLSLCHVLDPERQEFILTKSYRRLLSLSCDKSIQESIRRHTINKIYLLLNELQQRLSFSKDYQARMNFLHQELRNISA